MPRSDATSADRGEVAADALYLRATAQPVLAFLHRPARRAPQAAAVLMCPPFGWDEICSYRSRRAWAQDLAAAGSPTLRIDLPATGDSGGAPGEGPQLAAWTDAVCAAVDHLRQETGLERVAAVCIGLGGLLACRAIAQQAPIEELVLWAVPARGRTFLRELSVFASLEESGPEAPSRNGLARSPLPADHLWAGGFLLSPATVAELRALDLTALALPAGRPRRVLMLDRDGVSVDERLRAHLQASGASVSVASGAGYGAMLAKPHHARAPRAVFARVRAWLAQADAAAASRPARAGRSPAPAAPAANAASAAAAGPRAASVELAAGGAAIRETPLTVEQPFGELFGILSEPLEGRASPDLCAVLLNAGAIRRIGPNRMWVEAARRWAALGVPALRLDLEGIGDAAGDGERFGELAELYEPQLVDQVRAALDELERRRIGRRFLLAGLCSGACWSFHGALRDERVAAAFMLNPQALFWDESLEAARDLRRGLQSASWRKVVRGEVPFARIMALAYRAPFKLPRRALAQRSARRRGQDELDAALDRLRDQGKLLRFMFSGNEPLHEELERDGYMSRLDRWPNVRVELLPGSVHTLRPFLAQQSAHQALDRALHEMLGQAAGTPLLNASR